jgi:hypothetical protein
LSVLWCTPNPPFQTCLPFSTLYQMAITPPFYLHICLLLFSAWNVWSPTVRITHSLKVAQLVLQHVLIYFLPSPWHPLSCYMLPAFHVSNYFGACIILSYMEEKGLYITPMPCCHGTTT